MIFLADAGEMKQNLAKKTKTVSSLSSSSSVLLTSFCFVMDKISLGNRNNLQWSLIHSFNKNMYLFL